MTARTLYQMPGLVSPSNISEQAVVAYHEEVTNTAEQEHRHADAVMQ